MSYQVIARKWRPQNFLEVTGQEAITRTLQNSLRLGRQHHAYIFSGPRGCGKTTTARILAKALNCATGVTADPCGKCDSCLEIINGASLDVLEIDAASNTGVDNVRDVIINTVGYDPSRDRYKIFIIDEVHMLSMSAFNALLKTLEEPPAHVAFILATTELHKLPQTILSRCQHFEFRTIATEAIAGRLRLIADAEEISISEAALYQIALAGQGSMRDAQSAFDQVISFAGNKIEEQDVRDALGIINQQTLSDFTLAIAQRDEKKLITLTAELASTGYDLRQFCRDLMVHFRNLLVLKTVGADKEILPVIESEIPGLQAQATNFSREDLVRFFQLLTTLEQELKLSTQPRFQLEMGLIKLAQMGRLASLDELLQRLTTLEGYLADPAKLASIKATSRPITANPGTIAKTEAISPSSKVVNSIPATAPTPNSSVERAVANQLVSQTPPPKSTKPAATSSRVANRNAMPEPPPEPPTDLIEPEYLSNEPGFIAKPSAQRGNVASQVPINEPVTPLKPKNIADPIEALKTELENRKKMMILTALDSAKLNIAGSNLSIRFETKNSELFKKINAKDTRQIIIEAAHTALGLDLKLDIKLTDGDETLVEDEELLAQLKIRNQVENDPTVQHFKKIFKAEVVDIQKEE